MRILPQLCDPNPLPRIVVNGHTADRTPHATDVMTRFSVFSVMSNNARQLVSERLRLVDLEVSQIQCVGDVGRAVRAFTRVPCFRVSAREDLEIQAKYDGSEENLPCFCVWCIGGANITFARQVIAAEETIERMVDS